ncbi:transcription factor COE3-like, partial [Dendronephthya gigantea]|uniref:transcription factor COE3-like n=1 Tax=Dendronephthya gigantea TaxID=151771 RepID=UPI00106B9600
MDAVPRLKRIEFKKQPPQNVRKSNFFHVDVALLSEQDRLLDVETARFKSFIYQDPQTNEMSNGLRYMIKFSSEEGSSKSVPELEVDIHLVDWNTKEVIMYDGKDKHPELKKVLLTHEVLCSRCNENKSCGNRIQTPADPVIDKSMTGKLTFHLKCNQNGLKNAGTPKRKRLFQIRVSTEKIPLGYSEKFFVHNNSKYSNVRRVKRPKGFTGITFEPTIHAICPNEAWTSGGTKVFVIGENFLDGVQVVFGSVIVWSEIVTPQVISVLTPPTQSPGTVDVTLIFKSIQYCKRDPAKFVYSVVPPLSALPPTQNSGNIPIAPSMFTFPGITSSSIASPASCSYTTNEKRVIVNGTNGTLPGI